MMTSKEKQRTKIYSITSSAVRHRINYMLELDPEFARSLNRILDTGIRSWTTTRDFTDDFLSKPSVYNLPGTWEKQPDAMIPHLN